MANISTTDIKGAAEAPKAPANVLEITCRFCGVKTGEAEIPPRLLGQEVTLADLDIADSRCDVCITEKGTVQEAEAHYEAKMHDEGGTPEEFAQKLEELDGDAKAMIEWTEEEKSRRVAERQAVADAEAKAADVAQAEK